MERPYRIAAHNLQTEQRPELRYTRPLSACIAPAAVVAVLLVPILVIQTCLDGGLPLRPIVDTFQDVLMMAMPATFALLVVPISKRLRLQLVSRAREVLHLAVIVGTHATVVLMGEVFAFQARSGIELKPYRIECVEGPSGRQACLYGDWGMYHVYVAEPWTITMRLDHSISRTVPKPPRLQWQSSETLVVVDSAGVPLLDDRSIKRPLWVGPH